MLNIYYGDMPEAIRNAPNYFNNVYLDAWLEDDLNRQMIRSVDKGEVLGGRMLWRPRRWESFRRPNSPVGSAR